MCYNSFYATILGKTSAPIVFPRIVVASIVEKIQWIQCKNLWSNKPGGRD